MSLEQIIELKNSRGGNNRRRTPAMGGLKSAGNQKSVRLNEPYRRNSDKRSNRAPLKTPECAIKMLLNNFQAGTLIGVGGVLIKELMEVSGASVHISGSQDVHPGTGDRVVYITGSEDAVTSAQSLIWEMIAMMNTAQDQRSGKSMEWSPSATFSDPGAHDEVAVEGKITIPASAAGLIIGKGGSTIRAIMEESGAKLGVSGNDSDDTYLTNERVVSISGRAVECINSTSLILSRLVGSPDESVYLTRGTKYPNPNFLRERYERDDLAPTAHVVSSAPFSGKEIVQPTGASQSNIFSSHDGVGILRPSAGGAVGSIISASTTFKMAVPNALIGNIMGKQGTTLKEIMSLSGAQITLSKRGEYIEGTADRILTIEGSPANAQTAHTLISNKLTSGMA